jgi:hypothetical protein
MGKRGMVLCGVGSLALLLAGCVVLAVAIVGHVNLSSIVLTGMCALFALSLALGFAAWLLGLMKTARIGRWDWFITVLILGMPGALIYGIGGPAGRPYTMVNASHAQPPRAYMR